MVFLVNLEWMASLALRVHVALVELWVTVDQRVTVDRRVSASLGRLGPKVTLDQQELLERRVLLACRALGVSPDQWPTKGSLARLEKRAHLVLLGLLVRKIVRLACPMSKGRFAVAVVSRRNVQHIWFQLGISLAGAKPHL